MIVEPKLITEDVKMKLSSGIENTVIFDSVYANMA